MKTEISDSLNDLRGRMGKWVYRRFEGNIVVARRPKITVEPTAAQIQQQKRFTRAAAYARAVFKDPARKAVYADAAKAAGRSTVFALAMGDYLKPPVVEEIDLTGYSGRIGDPIGIAASDDFEVTGVKVTIRNTAGTTLEEGPATKGDIDWVYRGKTAVPTDENLIIEAEASDRAGNQRTLSETWHA